MRTSRALAGRRVAVTGAAGFIGRHLTSALEAAGAEVVVDVGGLVLAGCDTVVHLAYRPPRPGSPAPLADELRTNVAATSHLLRLAASAGVTHIAFASSTSVYAPGAGVPETALPTPTTAYARAKLLQEARLLRWGGAGSGRSVAVLRLSTVYGPGEREHRAIPSFVRAALEARAPVVAGRGIGPFDPVFVGDVADAFVAAVATAAAGIFNIGTGTARRPLDVARLVTELAGLTRRPVLDPAADDRPRPICDVSKASGILGWVAATPLRTGLEAELEWARQRVAH